MLHSLITNSIKYTGVAKIGSLVTKKLPALRKSITPDVPSSIVSTHITKIRDDTNTVTSDENIVSKSATVITESISEVVESVQNDITLQEEEEEEVLPLPLIEDITAIETQPSVIEENIDDVRMEEEQEEQDDNFVDDAADVVAEDNQEHDEVVADAEDTGIEPELAPIDNIDHVPSSSIKSTSKIVNSSIKGSKSNTKRDLVTKTIAKAKGKNTKASPFEGTGRSKRAGLVFPVGRNLSKIKAVHPDKRIGVFTSVYLSAVLEYLTAELIEMGGNAAHDNHKKRITPRHLVLAIRNDEDFHILLKNVHIPSGGCIPGIHTALLPKKTQIRLAREESMNAGENVETMEDMEED